MKSEYELKLYLMHVLSKKLKLLLKNKTQTDLSKELGLSQPRFNLLVNCRYQSFKLQTIVSYLNKLGVVVSVEHLSFNASFEDCLKDLLLETINFHYVELLMNPCEEFFNVSQYNLAKIFGTSQSTVNHIMNFKAESVSLKNLIIITSKIGYRLKVKRSNASIMIYIK
ncbi:hypothetical protein L7E35_004634 [Vibrio parahaemolyticus]|nr:hypothetical protein [Vibrio parahaemolyticus]EIV1599688.1 hypothetical protein [Vibrio parahaemolyticus]